MYLIFEESEQHSCAKTFFIRKLGPTHGMSLTKIPLQKIIFMKCYSIV